MIYERTLVSCICGFKGIYYKPNFKSHMDDCEYVKQMLNPLKGYKALKSDSNNCKPKTIIYKSTMKAPETKQIYDCNTIINKKKSYYMYKPFQESSAQFDFPLYNHLQNKDIKMKMNSLELCINSNWDSIKALISQENRKDWHAYPIQADRYEMQLSFDKEEQLNCWNQFCSQYNYKKSDMHDILEFARSNSEYDLGKVAFSEGILATPSLILCSNKEEQNFHLDIMGDTRKQYGMLLSHGSTTTMVCRSDMKKPIQKFDELIPILGMYTVNPERGWKDWNDPSKYLLNKIGSIGEDFNAGKDSKELDDGIPSSLKYVREGYGDLFRISSELEKSKDDIYPWKSVKVADCPSGTFYSVNGGEIHAGAGASQDQVRILLFWTYHKQTLAVYNVEDQETKLTLMVKIGGDIWSELGDNKLRREIIFVIYYTYLTCNTSYQQTCLNTFRNYTHIPSMIKDFPDLPKKNSKNIPKNILKMVNKYASIDDLFGVVQINLDDTVENTMDDTVQDL